jgi:hypothetical protein
MGSRAKTEKISVTLPRELVNEIRSNVPRGEVSSFFTGALENYLMYRKQKLALEQGFGAWKDESHPDLKTSRDSRELVERIRGYDKKRLERLGGGVAE